MRSDSSRHSLFAVVIIIIKLLSILVGFSVSVCCFLQCGCVCCRSLEIKREALGLVLWVFLTLKSVQSPVWSSRSSVFPYGLLVFILI